MDITPDNRAPDDTGRTLLIPAGGDSAGGAHLTPLDGCDKATVRRLALRNLVTTLTCTSCMLSLYGYDFGITAWSVLSIKAKGWEGSSDVYKYLAFHSEALGTIVACVPIGGMIGGLIGRRITHSGGLKTEIRLVNILCIAGALLETMSGLHTWSSFWYVVLYAVGRVCYGLGISVSLRAGPMYIRETLAPSFLDAGIVSVKLAMVFGIIVSYTVGSLLDNTLYGYSGALLIASVSLTCLYFMPESPHFMLLHEEEYSRAQVLEAVRFTNPTATEEDVQTLKDQLVAEVLSHTPGHPSYTAVGDLTNGNAGNANGHRAELGGEAPVGSGGDSGVQAVDAAAAGGASVSSQGYEALDGTPEKQMSLEQSVKNLPSLTKAPGMRASLVLTAGLMVCEQASGMTAILYYGGVFLADVDIIDVDVGLALLGVLQLVMAIIVMYTMNPIGRKPLLLYGLAGLFLSAAMLTTGGILGISTSGRWWCLIGMYAFTACYSISLGALVWVLVSEVFPTCHRAQAISIVSTAHFATAATFVVLLPVTQDWGGYATMFLCFMVVAFFANIFAHRYMVETRGLTLLEVQRALTLKARFGAMKPAEQMARV